MGGGAPATPHLRQDGADAAQIQALLGHASPETTARYFRAGAAETTQTVEP